ncbi:AAA family ATPase [uncultured Desulfosarcina sp.]|uniref:AAA family ATPase n=1 Tax=uncultured Desulfosarcina sp. TaxID=218289 RepID=UPI0029C77616|nr:AAA family ATPase [uncultured Desulfosarcina sp.]
MNNHIISVTLNKENYPSDYDYPFSLPIFNQTKRILFDFPVTFFVGENGTGKSTLLEAMALASDIHIWRRSEGVRCQVNQYEKQLYKYISLEWANGKVPGSYFGSEIFNDFRRIVDNWAASDPGQLQYFGGKSLVTQSHGQSIMSYFRSRYKRRGIYFLDEPETALSPRSQLEFLDILHQNGKEGHAQFIIATHSPILMGYEGARIYSFDHRSVNAIAYQETEHYQIYKRLLLEN